MLPNAVGIRVVEVYLDLLRPDIREVQGHVQLDSAVGQRGMRRTDPGIVLLVAGGQNANRHIGRVVGRIAHEDRERSGDALRPDGVSACRIAGRGHWVRGRPLHGNRGGGSPNLDTVSFDADTNDTALGHLPAHLIGSLVRIAIGRAQPGVEGRSVRHRPNDIGVHRRDCGVPELAVLGHAELDDRVLLLRRVGRSDRRVGDVDIDRRADRCDHVVGRVKELDTGVVDARHTELLNGEAGVGRGHVVRTEARVEHVLRRVHWHPLESQGYRRAVGVHNVRRRADHRADREDTDVDR